MSILSDLGSALAKIELTSQPVAVAFLATPPDGMDRIDRAEAAGCGYWRQASEGRAFYTIAEDHTGCPIGAYTHGVELSPEKGHELQGMLGTMIELKYIKSEEVPAIPHRTQPFQVAAYAPLAEASFPPDLVVFRGNVKQIMLLTEAAMAAGVFDSGTVMGRPACAMLPHAIGASSGVGSVGCIGNRVYTGLGDNEMYLTVPGQAVTGVLSALDATLHANIELEQFHRQRAAAARG
jgi:uncharacterized protein (DUF169 family)